MATAAYLKPADKETGKLFEDFRRVMFSDLIN